MDAPFPTEMMPCIEEFFKDDMKRPVGLEVYEDVFNSHLFFPLQRQAELRAMMLLARSIKPRTIMEIGADKGGGLYHWCKGMFSVERVIACEIRGTPYSDLFERNFPEINFLWLNESSYAAPAQIQVKRFLDNTDCPACDGEGSLSQSWAKEAMIKCGGYAKEIGGPNYKPSIVYYTPDHKEIPFKTIGGRCPACNGTKTEDVKIDILFIDGDKSHFLADYHTYRPLLSKNAIVFMHDIKDYAPKQAFDIASHTCKRESIIDISDTEASQARAEAGVPSSCPHEEWLRFWRGRSCGVGVLYPNEPR